MDDPQLAAFKTKRIQVYRNGDAFSPAKAIIVNHRLYKNWEQLLRHVATEVGLGGAVRRLYTLADDRSNGDGSTSGPTARIIQALHELKDGGVYVAASTTEPYKRIPYGAKAKASAEKAAAMRLANQNRSHQGTTARSALTKRVEHASLRQDLDEGIFDADVTNFHHSLPRNSR